TSPFRPKLTPGKQQIRAQILGSLHARFDYLFDRGRGNWLPRLGEQALRDEETDIVWYAVAGLREAEADEVAGLQFLSGLRELSPESGSFILFSRRRRRLGERRAP